MTQSLFRKRVAFITFAGDLLTEGYAVVEAPRLRIMSGERFVEAVHASCMAEYLQKKRVLIPLHNVTSITEFDSVSEIDFDDTAKKKPKRRKAQPAAPASLPAMRTIANLPSEAAQALLARLKQEGIPAQILSCVDETGVDSSEIVVEDADHDRAQEVAEAWDAERVAEAEKRAARRCPKCGSPRLEYVPHETLEYICRCTKCGAEFVM